MYITKYRPPSMPISRLQDAMNNLFEGFFQRDLEEAWTPPLEISEQENEIVVRAELPGVHANDIELSVENNNLTISGKKTEEHATEQEGYYHSERRYGMFRRSIPLPSSVDAEGIHASSKDGVLTITMPKAETAKPKRIQIKCE